jgi:anti-sigma factor RsiW
MPQLSLKQILAYLDDALEARTLREVSEAIAQSKELQELVARIQRVTRRRSLLSEGEREEEALPATLLAQYLEGTLSPEEAGELERRCLQDDAVLAEVATCHQLLYGGAQLDRSRTPPSAYRRMYGLLEGAESKSGPTAVPAARSTSQEVPALRPEEQAWLLGLPMMVHGPWSKRVVPLAVIMLLLLGLTVSLYFAVSRSTIRTVSSTQAAKATREETSRPETVEQGQVKPAAEPTTFVPDAEQSRRLSGWLLLMPMFVAHGAIGPGCLATSLIGEFPWEAPAPRPSPEIPKPEPKEEFVVPEGFEPIPREFQPREVAELLGRISPPVNDGRVLGTSALSGVADSLFCTWSADGKQMRLLQPQDKLLAGQHLQVWPGYRAAFRLDSGVHVELVGNIPEIHPEPVLDTMCQIFTPQPTYDADLLLERGWFVFTGRKETATRLRLRFAGQETWDVYLPPGAPRILVAVSWRLQRGREPVQSLPNRELWTLESGVLWRRTTPDGVSQIFPVFSYSRVLADVLDPELPHPSPLMLPAPGPASWMEKPVKLPATLRAELEAFQRAVYQRAAVENPAQQLAGARQALIEQLDTNQRYQAYLAVFALAACNQLDELVRVLDNRPQPDIRLAAREALHYWLGQYPNQAEQLVQAVRAAFRYEPEEAQLLLELLRGYPIGDREIANRLLEIMLRGKRAGLRYLAWANLRELFPNVRDANYSPDAGPEAREKAVSVIRNQLR